MQDGVYEYEGGPRVAHEGNIYYNEPVVASNYEIETCPPDKQLTIAISGGSMGGLFVAHALSEAGHDVEVYEQTAEGKMRGRGGGIILHPEMLDYLEQAGIADRESVTMTHDGLQYFDHDGSVMDQREYVIHGGSWDTLYRAVRKHLPSERYHMGTEVTDVSQSDESDTVSVQFDGQASKEADLFVAAEGYRSQTRQQYFPDVSLEYVGYVAFRGLAYEDELPDDIVRKLRDHFVIYHGPDFQVLTYPVPSPDGSSERGDRRINLVWYRNIAAGEEFENLMLGADGTQYNGTLPPGQMRDSVRDAHIEFGKESAPAVFTRLFEAYDEAYVQAVYDLAAPEVVVDRVCLLGDAAFFIRPHMAAGTAHAFADALALGEALGPYDNLDNVLARWNVQQTELGNRLVRRARERGNRYMNRQ